MECAQGRKRGETHVAAAEGGAEDGDLFWICAKKGTLVVSPRSDQGQASRTDVPTSSCCRT